MPAERCLCLGCLLTRFALCIASTMRVKITSLVLKLLGSRSSGQKLIDKRNANTKKRWGKKKAGKKSALAGKVNFDDLDSSDDESFSSPECSDDDSYGEAASALAAASAAIKQHRVKHGKGKSKGKGGRASGRVARVIKRPKLSVASVKHAKAKHICFPESENDDSDAEAREVKRKRKKSKKSSGSCSFLDLGSRGDDSEDDDDDEDDSRIRNAFASTSANSFPYGGGGRGAGCNMARAKATYVPTKDPRQASSHRSTSSYIVQVIYLVNLLKELRNVIPEYFMVCDSGATHHMLSNATFMAYLKDKSRFLQVSWGDASTSRSLSIGYLVITSYYLCSYTARSEPQPCVIASGTLDTLLVPD